MVLMYLKHNEWKVEMRTQDPILEDYHLYIQKYFEGWYYSVEFVYKGQLWVGQGTCPTKGACYDAAASYRQYVLKG